MLQVHYERIADFLVCGENVWYHLENNVIVFHDGDAQTDTTPEEPQLKCFTKSLLIEEVAAVEKCWENCLSSPNLKNIFNNSFNLYNENGDFEKRIGKLILKSSNLLYLQILQTRSFNYHKIIVSLLYHYSLYSLVLCVKKNLIYFSKNVC